MLKKLLGIAPKLESDGSFSPSKLAIKLGTVTKSDFEEIKYKKYQGQKLKILVIFTEQKNMKMQNVLYRKSSNRSAIANARSKKCRF